MTRVWLTVALTLGFGARAAPPPAIGPVIVLVPDVGIGPEAFALEAQAGGLAGRLARAGFTPLTLALPDGPGVSAAAATLQAQITTRLGDTPFFAVGHGLGGTLLAAAAPQLPNLRGWIGIGAPLAFGGATRAGAAALTAMLRAPQADWRRWGAPRLADQPLSRLLLTRSGLRPDLRAEWMARALRPAPAALIRSIAALSGPAPAANAGLRGLAARPDLPGLVITAVADGLWPPWQCDPTPLGLRRANLTLRMITRAEETPELGHLDLLIHPAALDAVHDPLVEVLRTWAAPPSPAP